MVSSYYTASDKEKAAEIHQGDIVRLSYNGTVYGVIEVEDQYTPDKEKEAVNVYKTDDRNHPGVKNYLNAAILTLAEKLH